MARPLRIEFPGAVYHVTARGDRREPIFVDDEDRHALLNVVAQVLRRFDGELLAYCLMGNHYHFVLHTRQANLSLLMRHINGVYTQTFNRLDGVKQGVRCNDNHLGWSIGDDCRRLVLHVVAP